MLKNKIITIILLSCFIMLNSCASSTEPNTGEARRSKPLNLGNIVTFEEHINNLGASIYQVNIELGELLRTMDDSDQSPDQAWVAKTTKRFPWLSGFAVVDATAYPMIKIPLQGLKSFNVDPLILEDSKQKRTDLRAYVDDNPLGAEIYVGKPIYVDNSLRAIIIVHFDIRALLAKVNPLEDIVVVTPTALVWPAKYDINATPVVDADWERLTRDAINGRISNKNGEFYWVSSYFANLPIIYTLPVKGNFPEIPAQLDILKHTDAFTIP